MSSNRFNNRTFRQIPIEDTLSLPLDQKIAESMDERSNYEELLNSSDEIYVKRGGRAHRTTCLRLCAPPQNLKIGSPQGQDYVFCF
jgi:hypothetical protein